MTRRHHQKPASDRVGPPRARFATVLILLLTLVVVMVGVDAGGSTRFLDLSSVAILVVAIGAATDTRHHRRTALIFGAVALLTNGSSLWGLRPLGVPLGSGASVAFAIYAAWLLFRGVVRSPRVTGDVLAGAMAAYILAGLTFAMIYGMVDARWPGLFRMSDGTTVSFSDLTYFSFVTLLTVGFGDVVPAAAPVRAIAVLEGLFGVVYTTVVLALLVSSYLSHRVTADLDAGDPPSDGST